MFFAAERRFYRLVYGTENSAENGVFVAETHFRLGGMYVDVHFVERHYDVQDVHREGALDEIIAVGFVDGGGNRIVFHDAPVDYYGLSGPGRRGVIDCRNIAAHPHAGRRYPVHGDKTRHIEMGIDIRHRVGKIAAVVRQQHAFF